MRRASSPLLDVEPLPTREAQPLAAESRLEPDGGGESATCVTAAARRSRQDALAGSLIVGFASTLLALALIAASGRPDAEWLRWGVLTVIAVAATSAGWLWGARAGEGSPPT